MAYDPLHGAPSQQQDARQVAASQNGAYRTGRPTAAQPEYGVGALSGAERAQTVGSGGEGGPAGEPEKEQSVGKKVLSDVSVAQITASALAAVTAMLFSSQIGLAGSAIGVAASAAVTALSSQIYKNFITASQEKAKKHIGSDSDKTSVMSAQSVGSRPGAMSLDVKENAPTASARPQSIYGTDRSKYSANSAKYSHKAAKSRKHAVGGSLDLTKKKWFAIIVMTVVGLLTVFITAHVINTATSGEGLGAKTAPIVRVNDTESSSASQYSGSSADNQGGQSVSSAANESSGSAGSGNGNQSSSASTGPNTGNANGGGNAVSSSSSAGRNGNATSSSSAAASGSSSSSAGTTSSSSIGVSSSSSTD